jgi:hypothetical protein
LLPSGVTEAGEIVQVASVSAAGSWQARATWLVNPSFGVTVTPNIAGVPAAVVAEGADVAIEKSASTPLPVSKTSCGLPGASSVMVSAPVLEPEALGLKVT